jgi:STE24 endopeptidase
MRLVVLVAVCGLGLTAAPSAPVIPPSAQPYEHFNASVATDAWLATIPPAQKARSDAYFEGGYWLTLWDFVYGAAVFLMLLETKLSARMRDWVERWTSKGPLQWLFYAVEFIVIASVFTFPLTVYEGFWREHQYGLSNQNFASWSRDQLVGLLVGIVMGGVAAMAFLAVVRRFPRTWHVWMTGAAVLFIAFGVVIAPVYIAPLFNTYKPLANLTMKGQILSLARANGIPATDVYQVDASRQSKRVSANVSGLFGTERITLNDNLLNRCSPQAVQSVMGHEMGHYVLHHIYINVLFLSVCLALAFAVLRRGSDGALARWGARWEIRSASDPAVLPLVVLILSAIAFVGTPITNSFTRTQEYEADIYGLNAARQPDGEAEVDLLLGEYRKMDPTALEEFVFFDHPSGRRRVYAAMRWKAENLCLFAATLACANPPVSVAVVPTGR